MSTKNMLSDARFKRILNLIIARNKEPNKKGFRTEKEIMEAYIDKFPSDPFITQGKISKLMKGSIEKQNGIYVVLKDEARYHVIENAYRKARGQLYEVKEYVILCNSSVMELFRSLERHFFNDIFDVRFDDKKLYFKVFQDPTKTENNDIIDVLIKIDSTLNQVYEQEHADN